MAEESKAEKQKLFLDGARLWPVYCSQCHNARPGSEFSPAQWDVDHDAYADAVESPGQRRTGDHRIPQGRPLNHIDAKAHTKEYKGNTLKR